MGQFPPGVISIHALREEGDPCLWSPTPWQADFYPRPPRGGRRCKQRQRVKEKKYFYPRPPRGGRQRHYRLHPATGRISIHALREEGDIMTMHETAKAAAISIHALREEGDLLLLCAMPFTLDFYPRPPRGGRLPKAQTYPAIQRFLSTPSARRATAEGQLLEKQITNFYPRPPRGGRLANTTGFYYEFLFLSTPSARRATITPSAFRLRLLNFYPRPPRGGRRQAPHRAGSYGQISIHALREEGDPRASWFLAPLLYFYPRPPRGGRLTTIPWPASTAQFLSTPSARRAT